MPPGTDTITVRLSQVADILQSVVQMIDPTDSRADAISGILRDVTDIMAQQPGVTLLDRRQGSRGRKFNLGAFTGDFANEPDNLDFVGEPPSA